jgi:hypothetical protein
VSDKDQADGFYGGWAKCNHQECEQLEECCHPLAPNENSGRGKTFEQTHDVARQLQYPMHHRLSRGFAIMGGNKHDL